MQPDRTHRPLHFLALGLAGVCLTVGSLEFLPWLPLGLVVYLALLMTAHRFAGRLVLAEWGANVLGLLIAVGAGVWIYMRSGGADAWAVDVPLLSAVVPYLGPVLMALVCVRIFRPRSPADFWFLQGLGLVQVCLGCVLATNTLFAPALFAYLAAAVCALAAHEKHEWSLRSALVPEPDPPPPPPGRLAPAAFWGLGCGLLGLGLFLLTPRAEQPDWDPLTRFGMRQGPQAQARTGFSEGIDLGGGGALVPDDTPAFWVDVQTRLGQPVDALPGGVRFRGAVLDRYEEGGAWRSELSGRIGAGSPHAQPFLDLGGDAIVCQFRVPRRAGGLFLVDPPRLLAGSRGPLPIRVIGDTPSQPRLFHEAGGTVLGTTFLALNEYRYEQHVLPPLVPARTAATRVSDRYLQPYFTPLPAGMEEVTRALLVHLARGDEAIAGPARDSPIEYPPSRWARVAGLVAGHIAHSGEFTYSLESERPIPGSDPTLDFILRVRRGPCEKHASALCLLLRAAGIPARIIKGYRGAERTGPGKYVVRQSAAHAWVEALVPAEAGAGHEWLSLDPTPDSDAPGPPLLIRWWQWQQQGSQELWRELIVGYNAQQQARIIEQIAGGEYWPWVGPALTGVVALLVFVALRRLYPSAKARAAAPGPASLYRRLLRALRRFGLEPGPGEVPGEVAARAALSLPVAVAGIPAEVVAAYYRARYGGAATAEELAGAAARVAELEAAR